MRWPTAVFLLAFCAVSQVRFAGTPHFKVDQFGYRPHDSKMMVISVAKQGFNVESEGSFSPGNLLEVRTWSAGVMGSTPVLSGAPTVWNGGAVDPLSGDAGWWFDFSSVQTPGDYVIFDPARNVRSHPFRIADDVYRQVLKAAVKSYYFQRQGFAKTAPYAGKWTDTASHLQDTAALDLETRSIKRDVTGGWMDAGDQNKYITFMTDVMHSLLIAWEENPGVFTDDFDIPESGNGAPDLLDEVVWALRWMVKMQATDGGVFIKTGALDWSDPSPPSADRRQRYYGPRCTSAGLVAASVFAHASIILRDIPLYAGFAQELASRAESAWEWVARQRLSGGFQTNCDAQSQRIQSGNADKGAQEQEEQAVTAAVWLYALTGKAVYNQYVRDNYTKSELFGPSGNWWGPYKISFQDAMLRYTTLQGADAGVRQAVIRTKESNYAAADYYTVTPARALYGAYMPAAAFHWGHTSARGNGGSIVMQSVRYGINPDMKDHYIERARRMVHWFHGVNALGKVYLTNMSEYGAENSCYEIYHSWFAQGTRWQNALTGDGPAPGIVPGGPNKDWGYKADDPSRTWYGPHTVNIIPPYGQPPEKSYLDWGKGWNTQGCINNQCQEASYAVTENGIYYQAAYIRLLAPFVSGGAGSGIKRCGSRTVSSIPALNLSRSADGVIVGGLDGVRGRLVVLDLQGRIVESVVLEGRDRVVIPSERFGAGVFTFSVQTVAGRRRTRLMFR